LGQVNPAVAVISAESGNQSGHPHPEVPNRLEEALGWKESSGRTGKEPSS